MAQVSQWWSKHEAPASSRKAKRWVSSLENLDEAVQRKPLSNILYNNHETLYEAMEFLYLDRALWSIYFSIYYISAELSGKLPTPEDWIAEYKQALEEE